VENARAKRALVTGGGGFIGHHLVRRLIDDGYEVRVLDNFAIGSRERLESLDVTLVEGDLRSYERAHTVYGDGGQTRDFTFVADVVEAFVLAGDAPAAAGEVINVCAGQETSILALLTIISELVEAKAEPVFEAARPGEVRANSGDRARAAPLMEWQPRWSLRDALDASIEGLVGSAIG
jgi:nucleoside-diphosphate-sugar epimerase